MSETKKLTYAQRKRAKLKRECPDELKRFDRESQRRWRTSHRSTYQDYQKEYQKRWRSNEINAASHKLRIKITSRWRIYRRNGTFRTGISIRKSGKIFHHDGAFWKAFCEHLERYGYDPSLGHHIDHVVSIPYFYRFNLDLPDEIVCDPTNIQVIPNKANWAKNRFITDHSLVVAKKLEAKYPVELKGFEEFLINERRIQEAA